MLLPILAAIVMRGKAPNPIKDELEAIRAKYNLPSICAGAMLNGNVIELDAVGVRRAGNDEAVTVDDEYHMGSITKSFTSALIGVFVQQGKIRWDETLPELFPNIDMDPAYRKVTVLELLGHHSGLTGDTYSPGMPDWRRSKLSLPEQRLAYTKLALKEPPVAEPGTKYIYANRGFMVLGCALEQLTGKPWETLLKEEILGPLGLKSVGFGPAGWDTHTSQPWGHVFENGKLVPIPVGPNADNSPILGPAGTLHMSITDLLKWCWFQAQEGRNGGILEPSTFKVLHTPHFDGNYACGMVVVNRDWAGGTALNHNGSNTMNYAVFWISPAKRFAVAVATNAVTPDVFKATDEVSAMLIDHLCPK